MDIAKIMLQNTNNDELITGLSIEKIKKYNKSNYVKD